MELWQLGDEHTQEGSCVHHKMSRIILRVEARKKIPERHSKTCSAIQADTSAFITKHKKIKLLLEQLHPWEVNFISESHYRKEGSEAHDFKEITSILKMSQVSM